MNKSFFEKQKENAYNNYSYFIVKMIVRVLQICFKLSIVLIISEIFNYLTINIIALIYTIISIYSIYNIIDNYKYILNDIKNTLNLKKFTFEVDLSTISDNFFKGMVNYGK